MTPIVVIAIGLTPLLPMIAGMALAAFGWRRTAVACYACYVAGTTLYAMLAVGLAAAGVWRSGAW